MNNLDNKIQEIVKMIDKRKNEISILMDNNNSLINESNELQEKINKIGELIFTTIHYKKIGTSLFLNERKINLQKREKTFKFMLNICKKCKILNKCIAFAILVFFLNGLIIKNIPNNLLPISLINFLIQALLDGISQKIDHKKTIYNKKATQNFELFGDFVYDAKRISETLGKNNDKVRNIEMKLQQNNLEIKKVNKETMELDKLIEEINCHKSIYDDVINSIYEDNMPTELKKKYSNTLNQESEKILAKSLFK